MNPALLSPPLEYVLLGALAGLAATFALSLLSRLAPPLANLTHREGEGAPAEYDEQGLPRDRFDGEAVSRWQDQVRSPASHRHEGQAGQIQQLTPEGALARAQGPGPEGAAERFAVKLVAGLFGRDITRPAKRSGRIVHFVYGSSWGAFYGLVQSSFGFPWVVSGAVHGLFVWAIGPGLLVPLMKVMLAPRELSPVQNVLLVASHMLWGVLVAFGFAELVFWRTS